MLLTTVFNEPPDAARRLAELGLEPEILTEAVQRGQAEWASCTANHPRFFPGIAAWAETVRALRELLLPHGWQRSDEGNLPFTVNEAGQLALSVATSDGSTGRATGSPCTNGSKGPKTRGAIDVNRLQYQLFENIELLPQDMEAIKARTTWFLLIHRDLDSREVRSELSRPINMNVEGRVDGWAERVILGTIPFDGDMIDMGGENGPQSPDIIVPIKRRG
jgi:hypothetical protein